jgi:hypothetical protein
MRGYQSGLFGTSKALRSIDYAGLAAARWAGRCCRKSQKTVMHGADSGIARQKLAKSNPANPTL